MDYLIFYLCTDYYDDHPFYLDEVISIFIVV